jgi:ureidoglycolate lyase
MCRICAAGKLIVVCPHAPGGGPDVARAVAFLAAPDQGITYRMNVWHHGLTVLDRPARFAVLMWRNGTASDEEFAGRWARWNKLSVSVPTAGIAATDPA